MRTDILLSSLQKPTDAPSLPPVDSCTCILPTPEPSPSPTQPPITPAPVLTPNPTTANPTNTPQGQCVCNTFTKNLCPGACGGNTCQWIGGRTKECQPIPF